MEKPIFGCIKETIIKVKKPAEVALLTLVITGASSTTPTGTQADHSNPAVVSGLTSQTKELQAIKKVECTTEPILPYQPETNNLGTQIAFTNTDNVPCLEIDYSDGSTGIMVSPFSAYTHPRKGPDGTYLFPTLCELPGIAKPIYGPENAVSAVQSIMGAPSYCAYPPVEKEKSNFELLPLAPQKPDQSAKQSHSI